MPHPEPLDPLTPERAAAIVDATLPMLGIAADPAWRAPIAQNLVAISSAARLVLDFPLEDEVEPAPVFRP